MGVPPPHPRACSGLRLQRAAPAAGHVPILNLNWCWSLGRLSCPALGPRVRGSPSRVSSPCVIRPSPLSALRIMAQRRKAEDHGETRAEQRWGGHRPSHCCLFLRFVSVPNNQLSRLQHQFKFKIGTWPAAGAARCKRSPLQARGCGGGTPTTDT